MNIIITARVRFIYIYIIYEGPVDKFGEFTATRNAGEILLSYALLLLGIRELPNWVNDERRADWMRWPRDVRVQ